MESAQDKNEIDILYNYPPKERWIVVNISRREASRYIYLALWTDSDPDPVNKWRHLVSSGGSTYFSTKLKPEGPRPLSQGLALVRVCLRCNWQCFGKSQILSLSWHLLDQLLHLPLKFKLSKLSGNEKPFWIPSQNSEYPRIFRDTGANQNARKSLSTDLVSTK